jgi:hypothetical protein
MYDNKRVIRFQTRIFAVRSADIITNHLIALKLEENRASQFCTKQECLNFQTRAILILPENVMDLFLANMFHLSSTEK